jgi:hypothetical protein
LILLLRAVTHIPYGYAITVTVITVISPVMA